MLIRFWIWLVTRFHDPRRGLFYFFDGRRYRMIDALTAARALFSHPTFDWDETPELLKSADATIQLPAFETMARAAREVFQIPPVEKGGLSELGCFDLMESFREFLNGIKKNGSLFPISSDSPASELTALEMPPALPKPGSDSGSMPIGLSPVLPGSHPEPTSGNIPAVQPEPSPKAMPGETSISGESSAKSAGT